MSSLLSGPVICVSQRLDVIVLARLLVEAEEMVGDAVDEVLRQQVAVAVIVGMVAFEHGDKFFVGKEYVADLVAILVVTVERRRKT